MKLFIYIIPILIFCWNFNIEFSKIKKDKINQTQITVLDSSWNNDFNGLWFNVDEQTRYNTKCNIQKENGRFTVKFWGACVPTDCEWGERTSDKFEKDTTKFELFWDQEFIERFFTFEIIDDRLKLTSLNKYKDNSGRVDYELIEYMVKQ